MSENVIQTSFASGELAPSIFARTDLAAYHQGLATCRNFFVDYRSGVTSRPGSQFVLQCKSPGSRLIPFPVSVTTTYIVEFGDKYCRFINNGAPVLETPFGISNISQTAPASVSCTGNNFVAGDTVFITGAGGMTAINNRFFTVIAANSSSCTLADVNGNPIDASIFSAYTSGGTIARVYTISSPYAAADLQLIKFVQSVSVLYITHPNYPPYTLSFFAPTNWAFAQIQFGTTQQPPTSAAISINIAHTTDTWTTNYAYVVTAVDNQGQESLPSNVASGSATGNIATSPGTVTVTWTPPAGAAGGYNIYKAEISYTGAIPAGAAFGFLGIAQPGATSFIDSNISPDFATTPPVSNNNPFATAGNYPGCCGFFQQRLYLASTNNNQATFWASQPGAFTNFNFSDPIQASDFIQGTIVSTQLNSIRAMLPMPGGLIFLTGKAAFTLSTGQGANATQAVTPLNATIVPQAYNGSSDVPPIVVNEDILYVQAKGAIVRDLAYNIYAAIYTGTDISVKSNHLFYGRQIVQWAWAEEPFKTVWAVRDDGAMLSLAFMKEQQIIGWGRHDTQGHYLSVATVQEGSSDATYVIVERLLPDGSPVAWIERFATIDYTYGIEDSWQLDAATGNRYTLPQPGSNLVVISNSSGVVVATFTPVFTSASVGQVIRCGGGIFTITSYLSPTGVFVSQQRAISTLPFGTPSGSTVWSFTPGQWSLSTPAKQFWGFDYLIGQTINVLADGGVVNNLLVAPDGSITLPYAATKVVGGLGFQCQGQTMPLDLGEPTVQGKRKKISALNFKLANARGLKAGSSFNTLVYMKDLSLSGSLPLGQPQPLLSGDARVIIDPVWTVPGQVCFELDDPVPATILGIIPEYVIGDTPK